MARRLKNPLAKWVTCTVEKKKSENTTYHKFLPHTDRMNYCSALNNNVVYTMAIERLMGLEVPERTKYIRTICCEITA